MYDICVVIPCYNEEHRLDVNQFIDFYNITNDCCFLFVNDGSTDLTLKMLEHLKKGREDKISILNLQENVGKASAVRKGMLNSISWKNFSVVGFLDADLSTPLNEIHKLTAHFNDYILFVFGSRCRRIGVEIKRKLYRHLLGRVFATLASNMLSLPVYDTQCGAKFFKKELINPLFSDAFKSNWVFDLEIFYRFLKVYGNENINVVAKEISLEKWEDKNGSKIKFKDLFTIPLEMIKVYRFYTLNK